MSIELSQNAHTLFPSIFTWLTEKSILVVQIGVLRSQFLHITSLLRGIQYTGWPNFGVQHIQKGWHSSLFPDNNVCPDNSIRAAQDFEDDIDRDDIIKEPCEDDFDLQVYSFADGHDPSELYVVDDMDVPATETDLLILFSPKKLHPKSFPKPTKSKPIPYQSTEIGLIAYHGVEAESIYLDYPYTKDADLDAALDKLVPDRLTLVKGVTGARNDPQLLYHRCSSTAGSSGGALVNNNVELVGMTPVECHSNGRNPRRGRI